MNYKKAVYWLSIVGPVWDIVVGAVKGIAEVVMRYSDNRVYYEQVEKFNQDNERKVK